MGKHLKTSELIQQINRRVKAYQMREGILYIEKKFLKFSVKCGKIIHIRKLQFNKDSRKRWEVINKMVLYNLYLVLNNEIIKVFDNDIQAYVYEGLSENIPHELMNELVHDVTIAREKSTNRTYLLININ